MRERPILFSTLMVQALLAGTKNVTRRAIKDESVIKLFDQLEEVMPKDELPVVLKRTIAEFPNISYKIKKPFGEVGDLLWVREAYWKDEDPLTQAFNELTPGIDFGGYRADQEYGLHDESRCLPGMFMPKEVARIWLQITDIRIERLFEISEADAIAEGVEGWPSTQIPGRMEYRNYLKKGEEGKKWGYSELAARNSFIDLWELLNGKESVNSNPWVWAINFKVLSTNGRPAIADQEAAAV